MTKYLDLLDFMPSRIYCGKNFIPKNLNKNYDDKYLGLTYITKGSNNSIREYSIDYYLWIIKFWRRLQ